MVRLIYRGGYKCGLYSIRRVKQTLADKLSSQDRMPRYFYIEVRCHSTGRIEEHSLSLAGIYAKHVINHLGVNDCSRLVNFFFKRIQIIFLITIEQEDVIGIGKKSAIVKNESSKIIDESLYNRGPKWKLAMHQT